MTDQPIPDTRRGHWWGMFWPRPSKNCSWFSQAVSVLIGPPLLLLGLIFALLQLITLPFFAAILLAIEWFKGGPQIKQDHATTG